MTWAGKDPLIVQGYFVPQIIEWRLVGVTVGAIDPALRGPQ